MSQEGVQNEKSRAFRELEYEFGAAFDNCVNEEERRIAISRFINKFEPVILQIADGEQLVRALIDCAEENDKGVFVLRLLTAAKPIFELEHSHPNQYEEARRLIFAEDIGSSRLNEILSYDIQGGEARLHLAPSREFIRSSGVSAFRKTIFEGLSQLAKILSHDSHSVREVTATSWIAAKNPALLEDLGFTVIHGPLPAESDHEGGLRPVSKAIMSREEFVSKFNPEPVRDASK